MEECKHNWQRKEGTLKERCSLCGTARLYDENRCEHEWALRPNGEKEYCTKCNTARVVLKIKDATHYHESPEVN